jgi:hypothetical protein
MALLAAVLRKTLLGKVRLVGAFFTALALLKTYPLIWHFATHLPGGLSDPLFVWWLLAWDVHALAADPLILFNANIFYPVQNILALSEHMIAMVHIFAPTYLLMGNLIFAYNTVSLLTFLFSGLTTFLMVA